MCLKTCMSCLILSFRKGRSLKNVTPLWARARFSLIWATLSNTENLTKKHAKITSRIFKKSYQNRAWRPSKNTFKKQMHEQTVSSTLFHRCSGIWCQIWCRIGWANWSLFGLGSSRGRLRGSNSILGVVLAPLLLQRPPNVAQTEPKWRPRCPKNDPPAPLKSSKMGTWARGPALRTARTAQNKNA